MKTENQLLDTLMLMMIAILLPILFKKVQEIDWKKKLWRADAYSINLRGINSYFRNTGRYNRYYSEPFIAILRYVFRNCNVKSVYEITFDCIDYSFVPNTNETIEAKKGIFIDISKSNRDEGGFEINIKLSSYKGMKYLQDFVDDCVKEYKEWLEDELENKHKYFEPFCEKEANLSWNSYPFSSYKTMENVFFPEKKKLIQLIDRFTNSQEEYKRLGKAWTLGLLLHGKTGTGKTSLIKAIANYTKRHIIEVPLNRIKTYGELRKIMLGEYIAQYHISFEQRLYLLEDIDCLDDIVLARGKNKKSRKKILSNDDNFFLDLKDKNSTSFSHSDPLTLSHLLNIIQGPIEAPGRMLIMTTNHPERLDSALIRAGRINMKLEMKPIFGESLREMIQHVYPKEKDIPLLENPKGLTPAEIEDLCQNKPLHEIYELLS
jgi:hypothetical protein